MKNLHAQAGFSLCDTMSVYSLVPDFIKLRICLFLLVSKLNG